MPGIVTETKAHGKKRSQALREPTAVPLVSGHVDKLPSKNVFIHKTKGTQSFGQKSFFLQQVDVNVETRNW